ncbi:MAG: 4-(cytidine 5'-diphospho)-2-C-methyl-D-erythritol kinase [Magnetococcales bacterium]|nr:4-(cytidine 5'-diphospho)-2-C-methyl-D-erythritol kinase [Magnetococcales bacterium]
MTTGPADRATWSGLAPAKVNLVLRVVGRRADGYHLLESLMVFFPLFDRLEITPTAEGLTLICDPPVTCAPEENLVWRAAHLLAQSAGVTRGACMKLVKQIPDGAGLGGGSSDAALTLLALNRLWGVNRGLDALIELGVKLGADVPFFLGGRSAWVSGIGERLEPLNDPVRGELVLVFPGAGLATATVFKQLAGRFPRARAPVNLSEAGADPASWLENDLELPALELAPTVAVARSALLKAGARAALMSGSGSTVFGLFPDSATALAAVRRVTAEHPEWSVFSGTILNDHPVLGIL